MSHGSARNEWGCGCSQAPPRLNCEPAVLNIGEGEVKHNVAGGGSSSLSPAEEGIQAVLPTRPHGRISGRCAPRSARTPDART